jgi:serine protease Do
MSEPVRSKLKIILYTSLALALGLGLASGFEWAQGGHAATLPAATRAAMQRTAPATLPAASTQRPSSEADAHALAEVSRVFVAIAHDVKSAVVSIDTRGQPHQNVSQERLEELFGPFRGDQVPQTPYDVPLGRGSGFIVSEDGFVLTNNHVVARAERIQVSLPDGRQFDAELVGRDPTTDVAILKIEGKDLPTVQFGDSDGLAVGEFVLAIGNPGLQSSSALPFTVTAGIVSAKGRDLGIIRENANASPYAIEDLIQTDAVINPGNSGGPLVNYKGEVIGINTAIASLTGYYQGYGFAIPINLARDVMEDLIEYGRVRRAALRVNVSQPTAADARVFGLPSLGGVVVQDFPDDSPALETGIERGDVIIAIDDRPVERVGQLQSVIASYEPGERVIVELIRYGTPMQFNVRLAEADVPQPEPIAAAPAARPSNMVIGVQVSALEPQLLEEVGLQQLRDLEGVLITDVAAFGPAHMANVPRFWVIQRVNGTPVRSVSDFDVALSEVKPGDAVSLDLIAVSPEGDVFHQIVNVGVPEQ